MSEHKCMYRDQWESVNKSRQHWIEQANKLEAENETLLAEIKANNRTYRMAQDRANNDIETLTADIDEYQQQQDEIIVALGSKGILPSEIVSKVRSLLAEGRLLEDAAYAFMRHIQDQIEQEAGWMQFDYYHPEIDAYEYNQFVRALGDPKDHARWSDLLERVSTVPAPDGINDRGSDEYANPDDTQPCLHGSKVSVNGQVQCYDCGEYFD